MSLSRKQYSLNKPAKMEYTNPALFLAPGLSPISPTPRFPPNSIPAWRSV